MPSIAIIPARGGSKRIPRKNIRDFAGKPIIAYAIEAAVNSNLYDEVVVSTDDIEIATIAKVYGASVPFLRSDENSNDFATTVDVLIEVLDWYKNQNKTFEIATCIYACAPFVNSELLKSSFQQLNETKSDCVFPVLAYSHPIQRALRLDDAGKIKPFDASQSNTRTQDLDNTYHDAGMFYTFDVATLYQNRSLRTANTTAIIIDELQAHDIDSEIDWKLAEMKFKLVVDEKL
jgi:pseudaminic acid cytidylyltransferase